MKKVGKPRGKQAKPTSKTSKVLVKAKVREIKVRIRVRAGSLLVKRKQGGTGDGGPEIRAAEKKLRHGKRKAK